MFQGNKRAFNTLTKSEREEKEQKENNSTTRKRIIFIREARCMNSCTDWSWQARPLVQLPVELPVNSWRRGNLRISLLLDGISVKHRNSGLSSESSALLSPSLPSPLYFFLFSPLFFLSLSSLSNAALVDIQAQSRNSHTSFGKGFL